MHCLPPLHILKMATKTEQGKVLKDVEKEYAGFLGEDNEELKHEYRVLQNVAKVAGSDDTLCSICLEPIEFTHDNAVMGCTHIFCFVCIEDWIKNRKKNNVVSCPTCRNETDIVHKASPTNKIGARVVPIAFPPMQVNTQPEVTMEGVHDNVVRINVELSALSDFGLTMGDMMRMMLSQRSRITDSNSHLIMRTGELPLDQFTSAPRDEPPPPEDLSDIDGSGMSEDNNSDYDSEAAAYDEYHFVNAPTILNNSRGQLVWTSGMNDRVQSQRRQYEQRLQSSGGRVSRDVARWRNAIGTRENRVYPPRPSLSTGSQGRRLRTMRTTNSISAPNTPARPNSRSRRVTSISGPVDLL